MENTFDVLVIGGGVTGAGVLRDAALRGLSAALVERDTFGSGTTSASSRLVHGGLRYLLYDRLTTHLTSWDSGHIVRIARPLLKRLPILWPVYRRQRYGMELVDSLLRAYDPFQRMKLGKPHMRLSAKATLELVPALRREGLVGSLAFDEWGVRPRELVRRNVESGLRYGGLALEGSAVEELLREGRRVVGARIREEGRLRELRASVVVNATGPAVDRTAALAGALVPLRLRQGTHLVYRGALSRVGLLVEAVDRKRYVFLLPFGEETLVGPTDVPATGGDRPKATEAEVRYLLDSIRRYLPAFPERFDGLECGWRPILGQAGDERLLSRDHQIFDHEAEGAPGLLTIAGGKLSSYRLMAQDTVDAVCAKLGRGRPCRTHLETLEGEPVEDVPEFKLPDPGLKAFLAEHPRLRQAHAVAYLAGSWGLHWFRRESRVSRASSFWPHYGEEPISPVST